MGVGSNLQNRASYWADMPTPLGAWVLVNGKALGTVWQFFDFFIFKFFIS